MPMWLGQVNMTLCTSGHVIQFLVKISFGSGRRMKMESKRKREGRRKAVI